MEIVKEISPKQEQFIYSDAQYTAYIGGVGAGKTNAGAKKAGKRSMEIVCNGLIGAPTYRMLNDSTIPTFREENQPFISQFRKADMVIEMVNGSVVYCRSAEDPDMWRGLNLNWFWIDEAAYCQAYVWPVGIGRLRQVVDGVKPIAFITCTPKGRNWIYEEWEEKHKDKDGYLLIRASTKDNPFLDHSYIDNLEANYSGKYYAQEIEGLFVTFEGLIYDMYRDDTHIWKDELPEFHAFSYGLDYGYTNPTAIVVFGEPISDGRPYDIQIDEVYKRQLTQEMVIDEVLKLYKNYGQGTVWVDPSEPDLIKVMLDNGIDAQPADNDITTGIQREQAAMEVVNGKPSTYILNSCVHTKAELASYCWKSKGKGTNQRFEDKPEKANDHIMDARRYRRMGTTMAINPPMFANA